MDNQIISAHVDSVKKTNNVKLGALFALIASLSYTITNVFVKILGDEQSTSTIIFARFLIGTIVLFPWFLQDKNLFKISNPSKILLRCITSILALVCVFYSLKYLPVASVLLLNNTFPLFLPLLTLILLKIKTSMKMLTGIIIGFIGVAVVLHPSASSFDWHSALALFSGFLAALAILQIRLLTHSTSAQQILFCLFIFGTITSGVVMPFSFHIPDQHQLYLLLLIGIFGAVYQLLLTLALKVAPARVVSPIYFSCILFSAIFDWLLWSITPSVSMVIGMVLIIIGGIATILVSDAK